MYSNRTRKSARIVLSVLLCVAVLAPLVGCGDGDDAKAGADTTSKPKATATTEAKAEPAPAKGPFHITAKDFEFEGLPDEVAAGTHSFTFSNEGKEMHELVIFKNPKGLSPEELFALGPEGAPKAVEMAGMVMAAPGKDADEAIEAELSPGEYEVICFIPTPTDGKPHFTHGMHDTITVS